MKNLFKIFICLFSVSCFSASLLPSIEKSNIKWTGKKVGSSHYGNLKFKSITLGKEGSLIGSKFVVNMESMTVEDIPKEKSLNKDLLDHLKNNDFFDVKNHKIATYEVTGIKDGKLVGDLTIKGVKKYNLKSEYKVSKDTITGKLIFNRTDFKINYKSKGFLSSAVNSVKESFIYDDVLVEFTLKK